MDKKHFTFALFFLLCLGCNHNIKVSGKVMFEDGSPLSVGEVLFESSTFVGNGTLEKDGHFKLSGISKNSGIPPGHYGVSVVKTEQPDGPLVVGSNPNFIPLIHTKYNSPATSGLSYEVKRGMGPIVIKVEPFEREKPQKRRSMYPDAAPPPGAPH